MADIKNQLNQYRERKCKIENKILEIKNLNINGANDKKIEQLRLEISELENENKRIDNVLSLLSEKEFKVVKSILIEGQNKKKIADEIDRTERQINRILNRAAKKIIL